MHSRYHSTHPPLAELAARGLAVVVAVCMLVCTADAAPPSSPSGTEQTFAVPPLVHPYLFAVETSAPGPDPRCPLIYGYVIEDDGSVFRYDDSCMYGSTPVSAPDGLQTQDDLDDRYAFRRVFVGRVDADEVRRRAAVALPASRGTLRAEDLDWSSHSIPATIARLYYSHTTRTLIAYLYTPATYLYRRVPLRVIGAHNASSNSQAGAELADWLDRAIDPDARDAGIARDLAALPVESLDAGCSGGIAGGSSRVVIDRSGLVTVSDTRRTHPQAERIWNISPTAAETLLDQATHDQLMQRDLRGGTPDDACWLGATVGAVRHEISWNGANPKLPVDIRRLFESIEAVVARPPPCPKG